MSMKEPKDFHLFPHQGEGLLSSGDLATASEPLCHGWYLSHDPLMFSVHIPSALQLLA